MIFNKKGSSGGTLALMIVIMLTINVGLSLTQLGVNSLTDDSPLVFDDSASPYNNYITGDIENGRSTLTSSLLPSDESVTGDTGDEISDTYTSSKSWFKKDLTGLGFISNLFSQPAGFLRTIGVPNVITTPVQVLWGAIALIFITAFIFGRN